MKIGDTIYTKSLFSNKWTPAVEAPEDLTATTNDMMRRASSARNADPGDFNPSRTSDQTRQEDAGNAQPPAGGGLSDDLGSITPDNAPPGPGDAGGDAGGNPDDSMGGDANMGGDDAGGGDDMGMDDMGGSGDMGGDMGSDPMGGDTPQETPEEALRIVKLQKDMSQFFQVVTNTLDSLTSYVVPASTDELRKVYNSSVDNLTGVKEVLLELLSTDFLPGNYAYKLRKYVALRHVYSTVLEVLNLHFQILKREIEAKNPAFTPAQ